MPEGKKNDFLMPGPLKGKQSINKALIPHIDNDATQLIEPMRNKNNGKDQGMFEETQIINFGAPEKKNSDYMDDATQIIQNIKPQINKGKHIQPIPAFSMDDAT